MDCFRNFKARIDGKTLVAGVVAVVYFSLGSWATEAEAFPGRSKGCEYYTKMFGCKNGRVRPGMAKRFCGDVQAGGEAYKARVLRKAKDHEKAGIENLSPEQLKYSQVKQSCDQAASNGGDYSSMAEGACKNDYLASCGQEGGQKEKKVPEKKCDSEAGCLKEAKKEQSKGNEELEKDKAEHKETAAGMEDALGSALEAAAGYLESLESAAQNGSGASSMSDIAHDRSLVTRAVQNSEYGKKFDPEEAESARLNGTRELLSVAALAKGFRDYSTDAVQDIEQTQSHLDNMMSTTGQRVTDLNSIPDSTISGAAERLASDASGTKKITRPGTGDDDSLSSSLGRAKSASSAASTITGLEGEDLSSGKADKLAAPEALAAGRDGAGGQAEGSAIAGESNASKLRDMLAKRLRAGSAGSSGASISGEGGPRVDPEALENASATFEKKLLRAREPGEEDSSATGAASFAMRPSEDDAAIRKMLAQWNEAEDGRAPASVVGAIDGALLPMNSNSLFERVRQAHLTCVKRSCL